VNDEAAGVHLGARQRGGRSASHLAACSARNGRAKLLGSGSWGRVCFRYGIPEVEAFRLGMRQFRSIVPTRVPRPCPARSAAPSARSSVGYFMGIGLMRSKRTMPFQTSKEIEHYFGGDAIECLLCGRLFQRLARHLRTQHGKTPDNYRRQFGLPWSHGLSSAASRVKRNWTLKQREEARKRARKNPLFKATSTARRRQPAPFLKEVALRHLGIDPAAFGECFERRVRELFDQSLSDRAIGLILNVGSSTVNRRTKRWREQKRKRKGESPSHRRSARPVGNVARQ
jgi:hypothetical protein